MTEPRPSQTTPRRIAGYQDNRLDGIRDILPLANGCSVLDVGANRGMVAVDFARAGAIQIHGCDNYKAGINAAREIFNDFAVDSRFEVVDLAKGHKNLSTAFGTAYRRQYDIVLFLGVYHHLKKQMTPKALVTLTLHLADRAERYFVCRTPKLEEMASILAGSSLQLVHFSRLSPMVGSAAIWKRTNQTRG
jgi:2-polyprenyl-3-methyl-5-hydroxy-6-metoxy-1,4-benzoquinol methylase